MVGLDNISKPTFQDQHQTCQELCTRDQGRGLDSGGLHPLKVLLLTVSNGRSAVSVIHKMVLMAFDCTPRTRIL